MISYRCLTVFVLSLVLFILALINVNISPPPKQLADIPNQYGKTFCIPVETVTSDSQKIKSKIYNAYLLMIFTIVISLFLLLGSSAYLIMDYFKPSVYYQKVQFR